LPDPVKFTVNAIVPALLSVVPFLVSTVPTIRSVALVVVIVKVALVPDADPNTVPDVSTAVASMPEYSAMMIVCVLLTDGVTLTVYVPALVRTTFADAWADAIDTPPDAYTRTVNVFDPPVALSVTV